MIGTACPFCLVMLSDGLAEKQNDGTAKVHVEVLDVVEVLRTSMSGLDPGGPFDADLGDAEQGRRSSSPRVKPGEGGS